MKMTSVAKQFQALNLIKETDFYDGCIAEWYFKVMSLDTFDRSIYSRIIKDSDFIIDLMCGSGRMTSWLGSKVHTVVGVDRSDKLIDWSKSHNNFNNIKHITGDAFNWRPKTKANGVYIGGLATSMFPIQKLRHLFEHISTYLSSDGHIFFDFLPILDDEPGWHGNFIFPFSENDNESFIVSSTTRSPELGIQFNEFYLNKVEECKVYKEYSCHSLYMHKKEAIVSLLLDLNYYIASCIDSFQFDTTTLDDGLPYWPTTKIHAIFPGKN